MTDQPAKTCFVIMPYGKKLFHDGSDRYYDFEKIYRVLITRAVRQAGLEPLRADERKGSAIIHTDMFKDLRDHDIVLADLSLQNANVFYELGIRHVMSAVGTVLICQEGTELPFDIRLSRVVFYRYDGQNLDIEESERVIDALSLALEEAKRGAPDSPVHAFLESVLKRPQSPSSSVEDGQPAQDDSLGYYQKLVARHWNEKEMQLEELRQQQKDSASVFGVRALGYYCLQAIEMPHEATRVASNLTSCEQYDLAIQIYKRLADVRPLTSNEWLIYGIAVSESQMDLPGASELFQHAVETAGADPRAVARCSFELAELAERRWRLRQEKGDLKAALASIEEAKNSWYKLEAGSFSLGRVAWLHLRSLILLRIRDDNRDRPDHERNRQAILNLKIDDAVDLVDAMYLRWCKSLALADGGDGDGAKQLAMVALREDAKSPDRLGSLEIRRIGYSRLRRLIEQLSHWSPQSVQVGQVTQVLQISANERRR